MAHGTQLLFDNKVSSKKLVYRYKAHYIDNVRESRSLTVR